MTKQSTLLPTSNDKNDKNWYMVGSFDYWFCLMNSHKDIYIFGNDWSFNKGMYPSKLYIDINSPAYTAKLADEDQVALLLLRNGVSL